MKNNPEDNELCNSIIHQLTTALNANHFTTIELGQTLNRFIAPRANRFSINNYDHAVTRYMEDTPKEDDPNINPDYREDFH